MDLNEPAAEVVQRVQRQKSTTKLRFGRDKIFRPASGTQRSPTLRKTNSASSNSLAESSETDGEELTTWQIGAQGARPRADSDPTPIQPSPSLRSESAGEPTDGLSCQSLADLEILATIGER